MAAFTQSPDGTPPWALGVERNSFSRSVISGLGLMISLSALVGDGGGQLQTDPSIRQQSTVSCSARPSVKKIDVVVVGGVIVPLLT